MKRIIFLLLISFCSRDKDDESHQSGTNLDVATTIYVVDKSFWLNGEEVWDLYNDGGVRSFVIQK